MDASGQLLAILLVLLPVLSFITGKVILRRQDNAEGTSVRSSYVVPFLAGAAYAIALFFFAAIAIASLINIINDLSVEFGVLFVLVCAVGFLTMKARIKLVKKILGQQAEHNTGKLRLLLPFCFGAVGGITGLLSLGVFEDAFLDSKGVINFLTNWYGSSLLSNDLLGAMILWLLWIALAVLSCLFTVITTIILINNKNPKGK